MEVEDVNPAPSDNTPTGLTEADLNSMFKGMADAIHENIEQRFQQLQQSQTPPTPEPTDEQRQTLAQRLAQLESELKRRDDEAARQARTQRFTTTIDDTLKQYDVVYPTETKQLVSMMMSASVDEVQGKWLDKSGKSLEELITGFFNTPFGQHLLKAPNVSPGSGTTPPNKPKVGASTGDAHSAIGRLFGFKS